MSWRGLKTPTMRKEAKPTFEFLNRPFHYVLTEQ